MDTGQEGSVERIVSLLGGEDVMRVGARDTFDARDIVAAGLPARSLVHLVDRVDSLKHGDALMKAVGLSLRTLQRQDSEREMDRLDPEQSSRTWRLAEVFAQAATVLGSEEAAEDWISKPAIGLSNRSPIDLLETTAGEQTVREYLTRMEYGVYV